MAAIVKACGYYRLSREDGDKAESDSIKNQKLLVEDYAAKNSFLMVDEYMIGRNFDFDGNPLTHVLEDTIAYWKDHKEWKNNCQKLVEEKLDKEKIYKAVKVIFRKS